MNTLVDIPINEFPFSVIERANEKEEGVIREGREEA
jgi:hypothetical protein